MYPMYLTFSEDRREVEEAQFWFRDTLHFPVPLTPFECFGPEVNTVALSQNNSRTFVVPPSIGLEFRLLFGHVYVSFRPVKDPQEVGRRAQIFRKRAGHYYENWDQAYAGWIEKMEMLCREAEAIEFSNLPEIEDESVVVNRVGVGSSHNMFAAYNNLLVLHNRAWNLHAELLNLTYAAYLTFVHFCKEAFPGIKSQTVANMVSGMDAVLFRPDDELKKLARAALDLGLAEVFEQRCAPEEVIARLRDSETGKQWLEKMEAASHPWFEMNTAPHPGFFHDCKAWRDDLTVPFRAIAGYIVRLRKGESIDRPLAELRAERDRIAQEYAQALSTDADRANFQRMLGLARKVYPVSENHLFYVENWFQSVFYRKVESLGRVFAERGIFEKPEDIFFLHRFEINYALYDLFISWATLVPARGEKYWRREVARRREMYEKFKTWKYPLALGPTPEAITDHFAITLHGFSTEMIRGWAGPQAEGVSELSGTPGAPGVAEGPARVIYSPKDLGQIVTGEVLVCPATSPSWAPVFDQIAALVTDAGGLLGHGAIVAREYGLPAVVGTTIATTTIKTGDRVRVDGSEGKVTVLERIPR
jgi:pyruvate,water dikinase